MISKTQYLTLKERYETQLKDINAVIENLNKTLEQEKTGIDGSNDFIKHFLQYRNIEKLSREILIALIDIIYVHEGGRLEIVLKFQDAFQRAVDYINANKDVLDNPIPERSFGCIVANVNIGEAV